MSIDKNLYAGINATYIRSLLLSAGFSSADLPSKPLVLVQKLEDYLQSYDWTVDWYDSIDPTKLNDKLLSLYDELSDVRNMKIEDVAPVDDMMTTLSLQLGVAEAEAVAEYESIVHHDVKLDAELSVEVNPEPVVIVPQEVVSKPQEELSTTKLNEDTVMNTSTLIPSWEVSGYVSLLDLDFGTYVPIVESEPTVELAGQSYHLTSHISDGWTGECSDVLEGWIGKASHLTSHISDGWYGQCCLLTDAPKVEPEPELSEAEARVARACAKMERRSAYASPVRYGTPVNNTTPTTTTTTKSGKVVPVSPHALQPHGNAPIANRITSSKVTPAIGEAEAFKATLFNIDAFDVVKQATQALLDMFSPDEYNTLRDKYGADVMKKAFNTLQGDIRTRIRSMINEANTIRNGIELTVVATQAPKATVTPTPVVDTPVVSTPTVTHMQMMSTIRRMNSGRIPNISGLNKLVKGYVTRNNDVIKLFSKFLPPEILDMAEKAYAQLTA